MDWTNKKVLVTGAGGFIGSHLTETLVRRGANVTALVRYNSRSSIGHLDKLPKEVLNELVITPGDITDHDFVFRTVDNCGQDCIFHLAAMISVPHSRQHPEEVWRTNIGGTLNVLTAAMYVGRPSQRVIVTSTSEVYGSCQYYPMDERHPKHPQSPYAASKIGADAMAIAAHEVHGLPVTVLRPFNTFGPRQSDRAVIPSFISQVLQNGNIKSGNLSPTRDFTYVSDTVAGFIKAAESDAAIGKEINLGTGCEISIGELIGTIRGLLHPMLADFPTQQENERMRNTGEVTRLVSNNRLARELLDWSPQVTLEEGLTLTAAYIREHIEEYDADRYRM